MARFTEFVVGGITDGAHREVDRTQGRPVGVDGVPHAVGVVGHLAFTPRGGDDHDTLHRCQASGVKPVHVNDVWLEAVVSSEFRRLFSQTGGVAGLGPKQDVDGSVACKDCFERIRSACAGHLGGGG